MSVKIAAGMRYLEDNGLCHFSLRAANILVHIQHQFAMSIRITDYMLPLHILSNPVCKFWNLLKTTMGPELTKSVHQEQEDRSHSQILVVQTFQLHPTSIMSDFPVPQAYLQWLHFTSIASAQPSGNECMFFY